MPKIKSRTKTKRRPTDADAKRWLCKARQVFTFRLKGRRHPTDDPQQEQVDRAVALARDIWRALDPDGFKNAL